MSNGDSSFLKMIGLTVVLVVIGVVWWRSTQQEATDKTMQAFVDFGKRVNEDTKRAFQEERESAEAEARGEKLVGKYLDVLTPEEVAEATGRKNVSISRVRRLDGEGASLRFSVPGGDTPFLSCDIMPVEDVEKDYRAERGSLPGMVKIQDVKGIGWKAYCFEMPSDEGGRFCNLLFWAEKEKVCVNLMAFDVPAEKVQTLARTIAGRVP